MSLEVDAVKPLSVAGNGDYDEEVGDEENNNQVVHLSGKNKSYDDNNSCSSVKTGLLASEKNDVKDEDDADEISDWESLSEDSDD
jgi:hypothetical protein